MKAAVLTEWKKLVVKDIPIPEPGKGEVLVKVQYAGICGSDITVYKGLHPTATVPVVPSHEIIGTIERLGEGAGRKFAVGDFVTMEPLISCGYCEPCRNGCQHVCNTLKLLGIHENGGFEEYVRVPEAKLVALPKGLEGAVAALAEPFAVSYHVNHRSGLRAGDKALIIGGGVIGMTVALGAKYFGASKVLISEINEKRRAVAEKLGLCVFDPQQRDISEVLKAETDGNGFDVVYESSGSKAGILSAPSLCKTRGTIVPMSLAGVAVEFELGKISFREMQVVGSRVYSFDHFCRGVEMLEYLSREVDLRPLVSDILPLEEVQRGYDMMLTGENAGKVLIACQE